MPCHDPDSYSDPYDRKRVTEKINRLTRLLCWLCQQTDDTTIAANEDLAEWWNRHQEQDRVRLENEARQKIEKERQRLLLHLNTLPLEEIQRLLEKP